jgi:hypothetical protein
MVEITCNNRITEVPVGKIATIPCNREIMKSDITISGDTFSLLTYDGVKTHIEEGKTATLPCNGQVMKGHVYVDTKRCQIVVYDENDATVLGKAAMIPECTVTVNKISDTAITLLFVGSDGERKAVTYRSVSGAVLYGVSESYYYQTRYEDGDSFSLGGNGTHRISIRKLDLSKIETTVLFLGLGYVDGIPCYAPTPAITWEEWVTYKLGGTYAVNTVDAVIMDGYVYTEDGAKVLYTSDGKRVKSTDLVENNGTQYTFAEVAA